MNRAANLGLAFITGICCAFGADKLHEAQKYQEYGDLTKIDAFMTESDSGLKQRDKPDQTFKQYSDLFYAASHTSNKIAVEDFAMAAVAGGALVAASLLGRKKNGGPQVGPA